MSRNIERTINDYEKIRYDRALGLSDIATIRELSLDKDTGKIDIFSIIGNAFKVGYVVGYRRAKKRK